MMKLRHVAQFCRSCARSALEPLGVLRVLCPLACIGRTTDTGIGCGSFVAVVVLSFHLVST